MLGQVMTVAGSQMTVDHEVAEPGDGRVRIGAMVKVPGAGHQVVGTISAIRVEGGSTRRRLLVVDLLGETVSTAGDRTVFRRGVTRHPVSGAPVLAATDADLRTVYAPPSVASLPIGTLHHNPAQPAFLLMDRLLAKNFAVLGMTGSGKSCAVTFILSTILADHPNAHVMLLDAHNEYASAFGEVAEIVNVDNLQLPFWLFDSEEAVRVLVRGGTSQEQEAQTIILKDAIARARRHYAGENTAESPITVDTPVPFRTFDLVRFLDEGMGKLDNPNTTAPYLRLKMRLDSLRQDRRFGFMFSDSIVTRDRLAQVVGRLLRIPVCGKPVTIIDLSGVPSEIADVVVSLSCRVTFDFALWSEPGQMPPILLICEEAHRYVPADERVGFAETARVIARIAKEGRKYGVSLGLISQRPSELSPQALSQCGTIFALRLGNDLDQQFVAAALPDTARGMLAALPSLGTQEAIVCGEGVALPMRIRFGHLPFERRPRSASAEYSKIWRFDTVGADFIEDGIRRWRQQTRSLQR